VERDPVAIDEFIDALTLLVLPVSHGFTLRARTSGGVDNGLDVLGASRPHIELLRAGMDHAG
jgi:hypothetical protein